MINVKKIESMRGVHMSTLRYEHGVWFAVLSLSTHVHFALSAWCVVCCAESRYTCPLCAMSMVCGLLCWVSVHMSTLRYEHDVWFAVLSLSTHVHFALWAWCVGCCAESQYTCPLCAMSMMCGLLCRFSHLTPHRTALTAVCACLGRLLPLTKHSLSLSLRSWWLGGRGRRGGGRHRQGEWPL